MHCQWPKMYGNDIMSSAIWKKKISFVFRWSWDFTCKHLFIKQKSHHFWIRSKNHLLGFTLAVRFGFCSSKPQISLSSTWFVTYAFKIYKSYYIIVWKIFLSIYPFIYIYFPLLCDISSEWSHIRVKNGKEMWKLNFIFCNVNSLWFQRKSSHWEYNVSPTSIFNPPHHSIQRIPVKDNGNPHVAKFNSYFSIRLEAVSSLSSVWNDWCSVFWALFLPLVLGPPPLCFLPTEATALSHLLLFAPWSFGPRGFLVSAPGCALHHLPFFLQTLTLRSISALTFTNGWKEPWIFLLIHEALTLAGHLHKDASQASCIQNLGS